MKFLVNHLTRMSGSYICVAGLAIKPEGGHVRPLPAIGRLTRDDLVSSGGIFALGGTVDLGNVRNRPSPPEVEDVSYDATRACAIGAMEPADFWNIISRDASSSLQGIFGNELERRGNTAAVVAGEGSSSLGILRPQSAIALTLEFEKLRLKLQDPDLGNLSLPVTDLRFFEPDGSFRAVAVRVIAERLRAGERFLISVGLTRAWTRPGEEEPAHWLQVNNLFPEIEPLWE